MKITEVKTFLIDAFRTNWAFFKVETDEGPYGWGEASLGTQELGDFGITVNSVAPGMVITENIHKRLSPEVIEAKLKTYAIHRAATAEEVAECVVNTIRCGAMTGEVVNLNSGVYFPA